MSQVLLLEDDPIISKEIKEFLTANGFNCDTVFDGELFFKFTRSTTYDLFLLDINVPKLNGLDVCKKIRETDPSTPIIILTAFGEIDEKVEAFKLGADDYLVKPFHLKELLIRIHSLYRRKHQPQKSENNIEIADLVIDLEEKTVFRNNMSIGLTPKEFKLLLILSKAKGWVLSKQQIAEELWDYQIETNQNTIEVYINFLRKKIDKNSDVKLIHTKVGFGYYLKVE